MPITVNFSPSSRSVWPIRFGSPPKRRCHNFVAHDDHPVRACPVFFRRECAPDCRLSANHGKITGVDFFAEDPLRRSAFRQILANHGDAGDFAEYVILSLVIGKVGGRDVHALRPGASPQGCT